VTLPQERVQGQRAAKLALLPKAKIVKRKDFTEDAFVIWLETSVPFTFKPGQYITIGAGGIERPYSIASAPYELLIELFVEYVLPEHGGKLTPLLWAQHVGDEVSMRTKPKGIFTFEPQYRDHLMLGTVTGVAPFVSIIRQYIEDGQYGHRFFIMEGASHHDELVYDSELSALAEQHPDWIQFVPTVSRPQSERNAGWQGRTGRVNTLVEEQLETWGLKKEETLVYLCGNPGMIEDVKDRLLSHDWNLKEERFWKEEDE
jgi:ferredoxin--NADP+ reductase